MELQEMADLFKKHEDAFLKDENVTMLTTKRRDLHAFLLLDHLSPGDLPALSYASHDEVTLAFDPGTVAANAAEADIVELVRCGVRYSASHECFEMFV